ncbi:MAG: transcription-repair coupling factor [Oscillospiraceae bacterium]|jgi:transcription-repair coupling factor (superfamily II helicase)|nr:transcription-repair coupling factor [Oscillospiraceae bacterium]
MNCFTKVWEQSAEFQQMLSNIKARRLPMGILGVSGLHKAHLAAGLCGQLLRQAVLVAPDEMQATRLRDDLLEFGAKAVLYPARDLAYRPTESRSREYEHARLSALDKLSRGKADIAVCSAEALIQFTIPPTVLAAHTITLHNGGDGSPEGLTESLIHSGYTRAEMVDGEGQFAVRGGILDIYAVGAANPLRVEFWGDSIDSMAYFDTESQRRFEPIEQARILPANEILPESAQSLAGKLEAFMKGVRGKGAAKVKASIRSDIELLEAGAEPASIDRYLPLVYPQNTTVLSYLPKDSLLFFAESQGIKEHINACEKLWFADFKGLLEDGVLCAGLDSYQMTFAEVCAKAQQMGVIYLDHLPRGTFDTPVKDLLSVNARQLSPWGGLFALLLEDLEHLRRNKNFLCAVFAGTEKAAQSLAADLVSAGVPAMYCPAPPMSFHRGVVICLPGSLSAGAEYPLWNLTLMTYSGSRHQKQVTGHGKRPAKNAFRSLEELHTGDYVVHKANGVGIFEGIHTMVAGGAEKDYIQIRYAKGDILYVPVTQLDQVSRYIGPAEGGAVKINRMGGAEWKRTQARVKSAVKDIARELSELYAKRISVKGYPFSPDIDMQHDFEARFEFEETQDQLRCIDEIKADMERPVPMDRLLCGDVGFGKTEVALRAAFKCAADGKQCAFLVPTTILAFQHYQTIRRRFEGFPIEPAMLSRFVAPKEQADILKKLKRGNIDIIVGTHALLGKRVEFRDLGLIIVDEEQRFGVAQKEKLKERFPEVDVLTLTATPIPRTLNMALSDIRDMSVIEEAPVDRHPVQTYVTEHDPELLAEAMQRELRRSGQVYYLHNRVENIDKTAAQIKAYLPDATVEFAHGQMDEETLSDIWRRTLEGDIDILVCTTIIETGVDIPNVNTLVIEDADRMGLAQLHQIRGRVGRSARRASAYLTYKPHKELSEISQKRLEAIREFTEFGSGFRIAMRDLELRGAGSILGAHQSGHMEAVGYDLYMEMLAEAVREQKGEKPEVSVKECLVDLPIDAHIPDTYISSVQQRLAMYRRIASIRTKADEDDVIDELIDRFGEPPEAVRGLTTIALVRALAAARDVTEVGSHDGSLALYISDLDMTFLEKASKALPGRVRVRSLPRPHIAIDMKPGENPLPLLQRALSN